VDHLYSGPVLFKHFNSLGTENFVVVAPDTGGANRARAFAKRLGDIPLAFIDKRRPGPNRVEIMNVIGDVQGKHCLIVDDIMDTARTITEVAGVIKGKGAEDIYACASHAVLSGNAIENIRNSPLKEVVVTNTIPLPPSKRIDKIKVLSIAKLLGEAINRIHKEESVSSLFE